MTEPQPLICLRPTQSPLASLHKRHPPPRQTTSNTPSRGKSPLRYVYSTKVRKYCEHVPTQTPLADLHPAGDSAHPSAQLANLVARLARSLGRLRSGLLTFASHTSVVPHIQIINVAVHSYQSIQYAQLRMLHVEILFMFWVWVRRTIFMFWLRCSPWLHLNWSPTGMFTSINSVQCINIRRQQHC